VRKTLRGRIDQLFCFAALHYCSHHRRCAYGFSFSVPQFFTGGLVGGLPQHCSAPRLLLPLPTPCEPATACPQQSEPPSCDLVAVAGRAVWRRAALLGGVYGITFLCAGPALLGAALKDGVLLFPHHGWHVAVLPRSPHYEPSVAPVLDLFPPVDVILVSALQRTTTGRSALFCFLLRWFYGEQDFGCHCAAPLPTTGVANLVRFCFLDLFRPLLHYHGYWFVVYVAQTVEPAVPGY